MPSHASLTITPVPDPHAAVRAEIARLDQEAWMRRNASHLTARSYTHIDRLERRSADLAARLPHSQTAHTQRSAATEALAAKFTRGQALYTKRQAKPINAALRALTALNDPALPASLHRQIAELREALANHTTKMTRFDPASGIPGEMLALLPLSER